MKQFPPTPTPNQIFENWMWDDVKDRWVPVGHHWSPPEAPVDHKTYGRRDGEWEQVLPIEGGTITQDLIVNGHTTLGSTMAAGMVALEVARDVQVNGQTYIQEPQFANSATTKNYVDNEFLRRRHIETITGDGTQKLWQINHAFDNEDVVVQVYDEATLDMVITDVKVVDADNVEVSFELPPAAGHAYRVVVLS